MRIYVDMDGVIVNLMHGWLPALNEMTGRDVTVEDVYMWGLEHVYDIPFNKLRKPLHKPGFWVNLPPYKDAINFIETLENMGHQVYIATAPFPSENCAHEKKAWFEINLPFLPHNRLILIHDKHLLKGAMLVDDKPQNLTRFDGMRVLFDQPWNRQLTTGLLEAWYIRVSTFSDILALLGVEY